MENILELRSVSKTFPRADFTLENVTFSLPYGAILGFVGENGAGKTTTIGCILNTITKDKYPLDTSQTKRTTLAPHETNILLQNLLISRERQYLLHALHFQRKTISRLEWYLLILLRRFGLLYPFGRR